MPMNIPGDTHVVGHLTASTMTVPAAAVTNASVASNAAIVRSKLAQETLARFPVNMTDFCVWDAFATRLPGTSANDDLGLYGGTFGTDSPAIQSYDLKTAGATDLYARARIELPAEYVAGETVQIRLHAGMLTTVADVSATVDIEAYKSDQEGGIGADLCATAAQSINSTTLADKDFTITPTGLVAGDVLDVRIKVSVNDAATGTVVQAIIGAVERLCDIRG